MLSCRERYEKERQRRQRIAKFRERQRKVRQWIALDEIADWCARSVTGANVYAEEEAHSLAYQRLDRSARDGEFEIRQDGLIHRSKILYLDPQVMAVGTVPRCRLTREQLNYVENIRGLAEYCWLPRELALQWLAAHGYPRPVHFDPVSRATGAIEDNMERRAVDRTGPCPAQEESTAQPPAGRDRQASGTSPSQERRYGPIPTADKIRKAGETLMKEECVPGETIQWGQFQKLLCEKIGVVPETRGYSVDSIQNALRPSLKERQAKRQATEINESTES